MIQCIDAKKCIGCGACVQRCPLDTLRLNDAGKAFIAYPDDCMTCFICERACPAGAIFVHPFKETLPPVFPDFAQKKGRGGTMTASTQSPPFGSVDKVMETDVLIIGVARRDCGRQPFYPIDARQGRDHRG